MTRGTGVPEFLLALASRVDEMSSAKTADTHNADGSSSHSIGKISSQTQSENLRSENTFSPELALNSEPLRELIGLCYGADETSSIFEALDNQRSVYPVLDAALILAKRGDRLDWRVITELTQHPWARRAVRFMLATLRRIAVPLTRLPSELVSEDENTRVDHLSAMILMRLVESDVLQHRYSSVLLSRYRAAVWATLVRSPTAWSNLLGIPAALWRETAMQTQHRIKHAIREVLLHIHPDAIAYLRGLQRRSFH